MNESDGIAHPTLHSPCSVGVFKGSRQGPVQLSYYEIKYNDMVVGSRDHKIHIRWQGLKVGIWQGFIVEGVGIKWQLS